MIEKSDSKWVSLATASILGLPPSPSQKSTHSKRAFLNAKGIFLFILAVQGRFASNSSCRITQFLLFDKMNIETLIDARWIIPVEPEGVTLHNHALAIADGKIIDILPTDEARQRYHARNTHHLEHHALIPGLINSHTHAAMSLLRGIADDLPLMEWLQEHIWPCEQKWVSEAFVRDGTRLALAEMIRGGTTCFSDMYFFPEVTARCVNETGIRATIGMILVDFPSAWAENSDEYLSKNIALYEELRNDPLISTAFAPHAPYSVSDQTINKMVAIAEELERPFHMHVHETVTEIDNSLKQYKIRPLERLKKLGLLGPDFIAVHMTQLNDNEIDELAKYGCHIVHCPESNLKLASGFCPVVRLLDAGINVALGTDGVASNNDLDMLGEMRTAALLAKGVAGDASVVKASQALQMATLNGAKALGIDNETGSLKTGKSADIAAIRLDSIETQPVFDPVSQIVYAANRDQITDVWVSGRQLLKSRVLTTLNIEDIQLKISEWGNRLRKMG